MKKTEAVEVVKEREREREIVNLRSNWRLGNKRWKIRQNAISRFNYPARRCRCSGRFVKYFQAAGTIAGDPITRARVASRVLRQAFPRGFSFADYPTDDAYESNVSACACQLNFARFQCHRYTRPVWTFHVMTLFTFLSFLPLFHFSFLTVRTIVERFRAIRRYYANLKTFERSFRYIAYNLIQNRRYWEGILWKAEYLYYLIPLYAEGNSICFDSKAENGGNSA